MSNLSKKTMSLLAATLVALTTFAQDGDGKLLDIDINVDKTEWYENPYIWVGVAAFIIIIALITRRSKA